MPFRSRAQMRWMFENKPEMAKKWAEHTPHMDRLPEKLDVPKKRRRANMQHVRKSMRRGRHIKRGR